jgi:hypothetical protein
MQTKEITAEFTSFPFDSNWVSGKVGPFKFEAKLFDYGSQYGINNGRVSKLSIYMPEIIKPLSESNNLADNFRNFFAGCLVNYDRGWDIRPKKNIKPYYDAVIRLCEASPSRFDLQESTN